MFRASRKQFEEFIQGGIAAIPGKFRKQIGHVAFVVEEEPSEELLEGFGVPEDDTILGLFGGPTLGEEKSLPWSLPPKITIFKKPCEGEAETVEELAALVRETIWHEVAHYLGMEEHEVLRAEERRAEQRGKKR